MKERKDLLAYCGFYCGDCLGYSGVIARALFSFESFTILLTNLI